MADFDFSRQTASRFFAPRQLARIERTRIGIAGAGGLGSNCAVALARCGFRFFTVADFDVVEASNLNRQTYGVAHIGRPKVYCLAEILAAINPAVSVDARRVRVDAGNAAALFASCDVVVEAFDLPECKAMLTELFIAGGKLFVCASGVAGFGDSDRIRVRRVRENAYVVGDATTDVNQGARPFAPGVMIAAAKQADVVVEWVTGRKE